MGTTAQPVYPYIARARTFDDLTFDFEVGDPMAQIWYDTNPDQRMPEREWCKRNLKLGDHAVDCGAHHGMMTVLFAKWVGPTGSVTSYEPLPANVEMIRRNVQLNGLPNVSIRPFGLGDRRRTIKAVLNSGNVISKSPPSRPLVSRLRTRTGPPPVTIDVLRLDDDLPTATPPCFLKLDVEGSDLEALRGAAKTIERASPVLDLELHLFLVEDRMSFLSAIFELITPQQYTFEVMGELFSPIRAWDGLPDLSWLVQYDNPHVFATPR